MTPISSFLSNFSTILQTSQWDPWLESLMSDPTWGYYRGVHLALWGFVSFLLLIGALIFMYRGKKRREIVSQKMLYYSFGIFFILTAATRVAFILSYQYESYYHFYLTLGYVFGGASLLPLVATIEHYILKKTHYFFTTIGVSLEIITIYFIFFPSESEVARTIQTLGLPVVVLSLLFLYLWLIKSSTGIVRKKAILTFLSMIILSLAIIFDSESLIQQGLSIWLSPITFIIGILLMLFSQRVY